MLVVIEVHVEKRVVHGRSAAAAVRFAADGVVVPVAAVTVVTAVVRVRAVILATVLLQVHGRGGHAVTVQVRVAQAVRRRDDDGRLGRLRMMIVMVVVMVMVMMVVTAVTHVGNHLIVRDVVIIVRPVIGRRRRVLLVVRTTLGRVRRFQGRPAAQALRQVVVGHQAAVIIVRSGRCVRSVRHHVGSAAAAAADANNTAADASSTAGDDASAATNHAASVVVHSHVSRLRT